MKLWQVYQEYSIKYELRRWYLKEIGKISRQKRKMIYCDNIMINSSCKVIACGIILSSVKLEKKVQQSENDIRISHNLLSPSPSLLKNYCIHSFWSQNTEKRNNTISQMRLRSVFKMRMSILNTATTEQMGYGSISFFVCFL